MPRKPREEIAGGVYHVYARANDRRLLWFDDADRYAYLTLLGRVVRRSRWSCMAYCLMDNHLHLLIETPEPNLARGMQRLHGQYAQLLNARYERRGHVFQGRYGAVRVTSDEQLWTAAAYIACNPVKAGLCRRPGEWPWSSHAAALGRPAPDWLDVRRLLDYFGGAGGEPRRRYAELVASTAPA